MASRKTAEIRKTEIVATLLSLADTIGPDRISTNDVAKAVGVTQAAIFRHFPTKNDLWAEAAAEIAARVRTAWSSAENPAASPEIRLIELLGAQLGQIAAMPALPTIICSRELNVSNPKLREIFAGVMTDFQARITGELAAMQRAGRCRADVDCGDAALLLVSIVQGLAMRWCIGARSFSITDEGLRLLARQIELHRCMTTESN